MTRWNDPADAARLPAASYDQRAELVRLQPGDRLFVECVGGPCTSRLELFPPRLEIVERGGTYVLDDEGPRSSWRYRFVGDH